MDKASIQHGGENVAAVLRAHGVRFLFTLVGGHISPLLVACEKMGIRVVDTRHEVTAVFAADAVARLTGEGRAERTKGWGEWDGGGLRGAEFFSEVARPVGTAAMDSVFQGRWVWLQ